MNSTEFAKLMYCKIFEMENEDNDCNVTAVLDAVKNLTEREQNALQCRYLFGYTLKEIAEKMNLTSRESARQIISRALIKLRNMPSSNDMKISNIIRERDFYKAANEKAQRDLAEMKIVLKNIKQDWHNSRICNFLGFMLYDFPAYGVLYAERKYIKSASAPKKKS